MGFPAKSSSSSMSILIIGASGRTGQACLHQLSKKHKKDYPTLSLHAFCRDASKLSNEDKDSYTSIVEGNARNADDMERALKETQANVIVVSLGNGDSVAKSDIRAVSAQSLACVLKKPNYDHVRVLIVSSTGAGSSKIKVGFGIGKLLSYHLRHVLKDHTKQEQAFWSSLLLQKRTIIVRATALTDNQATGKLATFGDREKSPTIKTDRADLAAWISEALLCCRSSGTNSEFDLSKIGGRVVNVTGVKM